MTRGRRWLLRILGVLALLGAAGYLFVWRPVSSAAAFLTRLTGPTPDAAALLAAGVRTWPAVPGEGGRAGVPRCLVLDGPEASSPVLVVVAGVTPEGIDDPRVGLLALSLRAAGFAVVAPELLRLARPGEGPDPAEAVRAALAAAARPGAGPWDGKRVGVVGVSLGGGVALRAVAAASRVRPSVPVSALLLVGMPDDVRTLAPGWFRLPVAGESDEQSVTAHSEAGLFARHSVLRAALPALVPEADVAPLRAWIDAVGEKPSGRLPAPALLTSPAAMRWISVVRAESEALPADVAWALEAAAPLLALVSPAAWDDELQGVTAPVFLLHGQSDPLVSSDEMAPLARRLERHTRVERLHSRLIAHVSVESPGVLETWRHLRFLTEFFEAVRSSR